MTDFVTLIRIKAVTSGDERWVEGWATTNQQDLALDVVSPRGAQFTLPLPVLFAHDHAAPIGLITEANVSDKGIRVRARLSVGVAKAEECWTLIRDGVLTAMSIGFSVIERTPLAGGGWQIDKWRWHETSIVAVPCNPGARISVAKCAAMTMKDLEPQRALLPRVADPAWMAGINTKGGINVGAIWDAAADSAKAWVTHELKKSPTQFSQLAGLFANMSYGIATSTLARAADLEKRIAALESYVPADASLFEDMAKTMDRVDRMQSTFEERSVCYRGYWRRGASANRGDMFTEKGSTWIAVRSTTETPSTHCADWCIAARGAKDAI